MSPAGAEWIGPVKFLRTLAPTFCFCTWFDLFLMYEQIDEDAEEGSFRLIICLLQLFGKVF